MMDRAILGVKKALKVILLFVALDAAINIVTSVFDLVTGLMHFSIHALTNIVPLGISIFVLYLIKKFLWK